MVIAHHVDHRCTPPQKYRKREIRDLMSLGPDRGTAMTQRAVIYARYSSENQREASIAARVRLCEEW